MYCIEVIIRENKSIKGNLPGKYIKLVQWRNGIFPSSIAVGHRFKSHRGVSRLYIQAHGLGVLFCTFLTIERWDEINNGYQATYIMNDAVTGSLDQTPWQRYWNFGPKPVFTWVLLYHKQVTLKCPGNGANSQYVTL